MNADVIALALAETARKRRWLSRVAAERLATLVRERGVNDMPGLRRWLEDGDGLSPHLAGQLAGAVAPPELPPYDRWLAISHLADGGMGSVWLAAAPDNSLVVIKTLHRQHQSLLNPRQMEDCQRRFEREAAITQHLDHPHVVRCLGAGAAGDGSMFMALEYVDSGDLKELVEARSGLSEGLALAIAYQVTEALDAAGAVNMIHRDLKPANIFVSSTGQAKLADFGIARSTDDARTMLTMEGALVGSPHYMAPEQALGAADLDGRIDIYAMGCVLYFSLAAAPPFSGALQDIIHAHCTAVVPDIGQLRPAISQQTRQIISRCMAKEREKRYANPAELRDALANALVLLGLTPGQIEESTRPDDLAAPGGEVDSDLPTMASDWSGGTAATIAAGPTLATAVGSGVLDSDMTGLTLISGQDMATMAADLMQEQASMSSLVTMAMPAASTAPLIEGDLDTAMTAPHIALIGSGPGEPDAVLLWAQPELLLGKLREAPIDLCLRNYPVQERLDECKRISRKHLLLRYDPLEDTVAVCDQGSPNGTDLDGIRMIPQEVSWLETDVEHLLLLAGVLSLRLRALPRRDPVVAGARTSDCALTGGHGVDALCITRPANRPEMAYAMVLRRMSIGGPGADLVMARARSRSSVDLARHQDRWIIRPDPTAAWTPLIADSTWDCGGLQLRAVPGDYRLID